MTEPNAIIPKEKQSSTNRQFHLIRIPEGPLTRDCFRLECAAIPKPEDQALADVSDLQGVGGKNSGGKALASDLKSTIAGPKAT